MLFLCCFMLFDFAITSVTSLKTDLQIPLTQKLSISAEVSVQFCNQLPNLTIIRAVKAETVTQLMAVHIFTPLLPKLIFGAWHFKFYRYLEWITCLISIILFQQKIHQQKKTPTFYEFIEIITSWWDTCNINIYIRPMYLSWPSAPSLYLYT